jgi:hypothetical protein
MPTRARRARPFAVDHLRLQGALDRDGDFLVDREDVGELAFVSLRPEVTPVRHVDQLHRDTDSVARLPNAALEHLAHVEQPPHFADVARRILELKAGCPRHHFHAADLGEPVDELFRQAVAEILILHVGTHVDDRQYGDPQIVGRRRRHRRARFRGGRDGQRGKDGHVATDWDVDPQTVARAFAGGVVRTQLPAQSAHLNPDDRIDRRVVRLCAAAEHL